MKIKNYQISNNYFKSSIYCISRYFFEIRDLIGSNYLSTRLKHRPLRKFVDREYGIAYFENPLVASQSISSLFSSHKFESCYSRRIYNEKFDSEFNKKKYKYTFTVVRDPWDRLVSFYNKKIRNANSIARIALISQFEGLYPCMPFGEFVDVITSFNYGDADPHWAPQHANVLSFENPSYIIKLSNLAESLRTLFKMSDRPYPGLPHHGGSKDQLFDPITKRKLLGNLSRKRINKLNEFYLPDCLSFGFQLLG